MRFKHGKYILITALCICLFIGLCLCMCWSGDGKNILPSMTGIVGGGISSAAVAWVVDYKNYKNRRQEIATTKVFSLLKLNIELAILFIRFVEKSLSCDKYTVSKWIDLFNDNIENHNLESLERQVNVILAEIKNIENNNMVYMNGNIITPDEYAILLQISSSLHSIIIMIDLHKKEKMELDGVKESIVEFGQCIKGSESLIPFACQKYNNLSDLILTEKDFYTK